MSAQDFAMYPNFIQLETRERHARVRLERSGARSPKRALAALARLVSRRRP
jgi:hypothetical protein